MYTHNYTDDHIVNIKTKQDKIIDFDLNPNYLCNKYEWVKDKSCNGGGYITEIHDGSSKPIEECSLDTFNEMQDSEIWSIDHDGTIIENLRIKELTDEQFFELWRKYPEHKWELLQAAANLTNKQVDQYSGWYDDDDEVAEMIDNKAEAISTVNDNWGKSFTDELDELISSKE